MKHLNEFSIFKNKEKTLGYKVIYRILEIIREENIEIHKSGGYSIDIDNKIYSFSKFGFNDCHLFIYNKSQRITSGKYSGIITGEPISKYKFSNKLWKKIEKLYKEQHTNYNDLEELSDINRTTNKYNI